MQQNNSCAMNDLKPLRFDSSYREQVVLLDGRRIFLRLLAPGDHKLVQRAFEQLSPESRYLRFFAAKASLSASELRYFTEIDQTTHFAILALSLTPDGSWEAVGSTRGIAVGGRMWESTMTVVDALQGRGLGRILAARLLAAAQERGILHLRFEFLPSNARMRSLLRALSPETSPRCLGTFLRVDLNVQELSSDAERSR